MQPPRIIRSVVTLVLFSSLVSRASGQVGTNAIWEETWTDKLKRDLFVKYDKFARPSQHYNKTVVSFDITVIHVTVNEFRSTFTINAWAAYDWNDDKLKWNPSNYGGMTQLHAGNHEVWQPDITVYNSGIANTVEYYGDTHCLITSNGTILWVPPTQYVALCELDFRFWPFDTQKCHLKIGSWTHHGEQIDLQFRTISPNPELYVRNAEWNLMDITRKRQSYKYSCCENPYPYLMYEFTLKRNSAMYHSILTIPAIAVVSLTLITFWLPTQSETKIAIGACTTLIVSMFLLYFGIKVPLTTRPPLIVYFYGGCLCEVVCSLIVSIVVINVSRAHCRPQLPRAIRMLLLKWPGKFLGLTNLVAEIESCGPRSGQELREKLTEESTATNSMSNLSDYGDRQNIISPTKNTTQLEWLLLATAIDRMGFILFCVTTIILAIAFTG